jgi:hypothetical protein
VAPPGAPLVASPVVPVVAVVVADELLASPGPVDVLVAPEPAPPA